jgi:L-seryl-tRNA(Ser) seleniumtransferase
MSPDDREAIALEARKIPRADRLLAEAVAAGFVGAMGHAAVMEDVRHLLDELRTRLFAGGECPEESEVVADLLSRLGESARGSLRKVVNATGVVIHTNLGRAPLSTAALAAMREVGEGYSNLEYDLARGERRDRYGHAERSLCRLTGAEAAVVVNNNAAAVLVALAALTSTRPRREASPNPPPPSSGPPEVVISRSQLVEIGGGFRIPDVLRQSGAALVEVGTTNRTYLVDYERALTANSTMLLSVHRSNFRLAGFVHDAELEELVLLGREKGLWVLDDLGSGTLLETAPFGLGHEPTVKERVVKGPDLVAFSGDKLLGGPQAGILVGRREAVELVKRHPLIRALRVGKATLAALAATLAHYERGEARRELPVWRAIGRTPEEILARAELWRTALGETSKAVVRPGRSAVGGGSLPEVTLATHLVALPSRDADGLAARLRSGSPAVIGRIEEGALVLDPRTVDPVDDEALLSAVRRALGSG